MEKESENRRQHYVPKMLLKNFSYNEKQIRTFVINAIEGKEEKACDSIRNACSKDFFYGKGKKIEKEVLGKIEGKMGKELFKIIENESNFSKKNIIEFIGYQILRTKHVLEKNKEDSEKFRKYYEEKTGKKVKEEDMTKIDGEYLLRDIETFISYISDLEICILKNETQKDFFISDNPVIVYNPYLKSFDRGMLEDGILIFLPISPKLIILLYDKTTYKELKEYEFLNNINDIENLNILQYLVAKNTLHYLNEETKKEIEEYKKKYKKNVNQSVIINDAFHRRKTRNYIELDFTFIEITEIKKKFLKKLFENELTKKIVKVRNDFKFEEFIPFRIYRKYSIEINEKNNKFKEKNLNSEEEKIRIINELLIYDLLCLLSLTDKDLINLCEIENSLATFFYKDLDSIEALFYQEENFPFPIRTITEYLERLYRKEKQQ